MSTPSDRFKELLWDRWTSPLYKTFTISWLLRNRDFVYILFFEDPDAILNKKSMLKSEYLNSLHKIDWNQVFSSNIFEYTFNFESWIRNLLLLPLISVFLFFFIFNRCELWFRKYANSNKSKQIDLDKIFEKSEIELQKLKNQQSQEELNQANILLDKKEKELSLIKKTNQELKANNENQKILEPKILSEEKVREKEFNRLKYNNDFEKIINVLWDLIDTTTQSNSNMDSYNRYKSYFIPYDLLSMDMDHKVFKLTPKWAFFIRKHNELK